MMDSINVGLGDLLVTTYDPQAPHVTISSPGPFNIRSCLVGAGFLLCLMAHSRENWSSHVAAAEQPTRAELDFFEQHIRPVLAEQCYRCHSSNAKTLQAGLRLDTAAGMQRGGDSGPVLISGKPQESLLIRSLRYESYEMPPNGQLPNTVIEHFVQWVQQGAPDPRDGHDPATQPATLPDAATTHWALVPPVAVDPPAVQQPDWVRTDVDPFVLSRLEHVGWTPSPPAKPRIWLRRLAYDLVGLPPTAEELDAFVSSVAEHGDAAYQTAAYQTAVDRLLESPHFGERWGRYWLDVARYADTKGYVFQEDRNYPHAYTYRDWVIGALNKDMPYDQFLLAQLAADQIDDADLKPAAGFLTLGRRFINNTHDIIDDRIDVVARGLMGLTVSCARCHDHKYDPITSADYYALYGVFASSKEPRHDDAPMLLVDSDPPVDPVIFVRGRAANRGAPVPRRFLTCLSQGDPKPFQHGSGRYELGQAIASPDNPLTARVWVNRIWQHLFGQGLVTTPSDFGTRCDPPSHPELLDRLAVQFVQHGWSTKSVIRQIVLSNTYRQAHADRPEYRAQDPENRLLWRMNRRRLDLEALRDSLLVASGQLDRSLGGPSVQLNATPFPTRRTVYGFIERQNLPGMFRTFDFASPDTHNPGRPLTTVPQQALFLMNSPFALEQAVHLAARTPPDSATSDHQRIAQLFRFALGRDPADVELAWAHDFVQATQAREREIPNQQRGDATADLARPLPNPLNRWQQLAHALLLTNEFAFVD